MKFIEDHRDAAGDLSGWYAIAKKARWRSLQDVRCQFADTDQYQKVLIFNIRRNRYRLIVKADLKCNLLMIKAMLTHKEYERGEWKKWA